MDPLRQIIYDIIEERGESLLNDEGVDCKVVESIVEEIMESMKKLYEEKGNWYFSIDGEEYGAYDSYDLAIEGLGRVKDISNGVLSVPLIQGPYKKESEDA